MKYNRPVSAIRVSDPNHPNHHLRQKMIELRRRCPNGGALFRMVINSGHPIVAKILGWRSVPGVGTWLRYEALSTGEQGEFSWANPGSCCDLQTVDESETGMDFAANAAKVAKAAAKEALRERTEHAATAAKLAAMTVLVEKLGNKLKRELGAKQARMFLSRVSQNAGTNQTQASNG